MLLPVMSSSKWFMGLIPQWQLWFLLCRITYLTSQLHRLVPNSWESFYESYEALNLKATDLEKTNGISFEVLAY